MHNTAAAAAAAGSTSVPTSPGTSKRKSLAVSPRASMSMMSRLEQAIVGTAHLSGSSASLDHEGGSGGVGGVRNANNTTAQARALASGRQTPPNHSQNSSGEASSSTVVGHTHRKSMSLSSTTTSSSTTSQGSTQGVDMKIVGSASSDDSLLSAQETDSKVEVPPVSTYVACYSRVVYAC